MHTQLNVGWNGVIGLRYEACAAVLARFPEFDRREVWIGLEVIEAAYLAEVQRKREQAKRNKGRGGGGGQG